MGNIDIGSGCFSLYMTVAWDEPVPIEDFAALNAKQAALEVPERCPGPEKYGGVDVHCGPILRLSGTLEEGDSYRGSIMLLVEGPVPPITYQVGSAQPSQSGQFPGTVYYETGTLKFVRYQVQLELANEAQRVRYLINDISKPQFQFFLPARGDSMNVVSYSCNGFSLATDTSSYKLSLWLDVLRKHSEQQYHVMLGGGDQLYCDSIKMHVELLKPWLEMDNARQKRKVKVTPEMEKEFEQFYLNAYTEWFGHGYWKGKNGSTLQTMFPLTLAQIPSVNIYDDHDIIDGFGSYKDKTMAQEVFLKIGNVAYKYYMLFQHQMAPDEACHMDDPLWITSKTTGSFIKQKSHSVFMRLGREISLVGIDCRTERRLTEILPDSTYKQIFARLEAEIARAPETKHLLVMLGVPILYPRLVWLEWILTLKVLAPVRKLAEKGVINRGLVNEFDGGVEVLDDLNDHWCSKNHKRERNLLIHRLTQFGALHGVRITILSGDVHLCCFGRLKTKMHLHPHAHILEGVDAEAENHDVTTHPERDPRLIFNVVSSAIINAPPPDAMASLLNKRSSIHRYDRYTHEDVVPLFTTNPDGTQRANHQFLNKRNWSDLVLVKHSAAHQSQLGKSKFPGPLLPSAAEEMAKKKLSERYIAYPVLEDSLVATLHVEADGNDAEATTAGYEVVIPELQGKFELEATKVKHL